VRVFLDANVLFSAAYGDGGSVRVLFDLPSVAACSLVSSAQAIEEARRNIAAKRSDRLADLDEMVNSLEVAPAPRPGMVEWAAGLGLPSNDAPILAAAVDARCHILATGDRRDFGRFMGKRVRGIIVMLPANAIELLLG
jgi:predicted nucleic acid-binding protein